MNHFLYVEQSDKVLRELNNFLCEGDYMWPNGQKVLVHIKKDTSPEKRQEFANILQNDGYTWGRQFRSPASSCYHIVQHTSTDMYIDVDETIKSILVFFHIDLVESDKQTTIEKFILKQRLKELI